jgi:hypothetical membrane protein
MRHTVLLASGIAAPVLYAIADVVAGLRWEGYSFLHQTISELGAIEAPSRPLFSLLLLIVYSLMVAFGIGVWQSSPRNRRLRAAGGLIVALGVTALTAGQMTAMHLRGTEQGAAGAMHLVEGMVAMLLTFTAMGMAAAALNRRFQLYTAATIIGALFLGAWALAEVPRIEQGVATPWVGLKERIFWYGYLSWFIVLALVLLRNRAEASSPKATGERVL